MKSYAGDRLDQIAYPLGGLGAGMLCLQGTGSLGNVSVRNHPDYRNNPLLFSALTILGEENVSRIVEAPVPKANVFAVVPDSGTGLVGTNFGLPRFDRGRFSARFPFATLRLWDESLPVEARITGWSPFVPGDEDRSSLPFAALEYRFTNTSDRPVDAVYFFCAENFMRMNDRARVRATENGFILEQPGSPEAPHEAGAFHVCADAKAFVDAAWLRTQGGWSFDMLTILWKRIQSGECTDRAYPDGDGPASPGATLSVPFHLEPGERRDIRLRLCWYVPYSDMRIGLEKNDAARPPAAGEMRAHYRPWYAGRYGSIKAAADDWAAQYDELLLRTRRFTDCFYDSTLPEEILDAVSSNLCILKSPTVLRQTDGKLWAWEGCHDDAGSCHGSCTHVWNYAQAICHLFPRLERSLRETEFLFCQDERGHQTFRAPLPIEPLVDHSFHAASDGQLGGIVKVYRDWRISGDEAWLRSLWPRVRQSLDFAIRQWDPDHNGVLSEPHHNTYDIEFWGPDGMCTSFYLTALYAACEMGRALQDDVQGYEQLYKKGRAYLESRLFNGEYFDQQVEWKTLHAGLQTGSLPEEVRALIEREGPRYQYGTGCISDGVLGFWLGELSGLHDLVDDEKLRANLQSIYRYNFKRDLAHHANPQRPGYALGHEAGLLLCTWPTGGKPSLPFVYSDEVWTGIEYQVASHLIAKGMLAEGLRIVTACRDRYDGRVRNPYDEYECGHWYARALASYALLQAYTGLRYDKVNKTLFVSDRSAKRHRSFLATQDGYGTVDVRDREVSITVAEGRIDVEHIVWVD